VSEACGAAWVVVDGYHFGSGYHRRFTEGGRRVLVIDDTAHLEYYRADLVLNQNICAREELYPHRDESTRVLVGASYALLRREFLGWRSWARETSETARHVMVTLGGGDTDDVTDKVFEALGHEAFAGLEVNVLIGPAGRSRAGKPPEGGGPAARLRVIRAATNMPELMAWADVAVSAGGSTCWELAFMGLPALLIVTAENQRENVAGLDAAGVGLSLGLSGALSASAVAAGLGTMMADVGLRRAMCAAGRGLVDGMGARRVVEAMLS
jgi:spore coat polysaccharide biosynthesis predicted glycosyltransferase SpsG